MSGTDAPQGAGSGTGGGEERGLSRRALLTGGVAAAGLTLTGFAAKDRLSRMWHRLPSEGSGQGGPVDYARAEWVAASAENWRRANRPRDFTVDRVVVHVVQGSYEVALNVFQDPEHHAASHYVVRGDGHVAQMVREADVAFHAGNRAYNERSVGIEHEGFVDSSASFTSRMYAESARLTADICRRYGIPRDREHVIGHVEVPGTDHTDPGPHWDWDRYMALVRRA